MNYIRPTIIGLLALAALLALFAQGQPAHAATITVNTTNDELNTDGDCSLREAIQAANTDAGVDACTAGSGADTITVPAGTYTLSIAGVNEDANATGDLDITDDLTINGASAATTIVDGNALEQVFEILTGNTVEMSGLTIQNGSSSSNGGGILNLGTLTLKNSTVSGNTAFNGGGIFNQGILTLNNSTVSGNTATSGEGGGIAISGGGGTLTLNNSTVSGNTAGNSGGGIIIISSGSTLTLNNSTVSGNSAATNLGGGIRRFGGTVTLKNTIVANNTSGGDCLGTIISSGDSLDSDGTCGSSGTGSANLGSLALNAPGTTATHALLSGSDAIDAGNPATPGSGGNACLATDQRGVARPQGSTCDIGAFELEVGVGGIAEVLVGGGESPASTGAGSGSSSLLYAAIVGVTAAAVALAAAGWYARRRWLR